MRQVEIHGCQVKKCFSLGLLIAGAPDESQRLSVRVTDSRFFLNQGEAAVRFENLRSLLTNSYENRVSSKISNFNSVNEAGSGCKGKQKSASISPDNKSHQSPPF